MPVGSMRKTMWCNGAKCRGDQAVQGLQCGGDHTVQGSGGGPGETMQCREKAQGRLYHGREAPVAPAVIPAQAPGVRAAAAAATLCSMLPARAGARIRRAGAWECRHWQGARGGGQDA